MPNSTSENLVDEEAQRLAELVKAALDRAPEERALFLDRECVGDAILRVEVDSLLARDVAAARFLEQPALKITADTLVGQSVLSSGHEIGEFEIISLLGSGGMGQVYLARDKKLHRRAALKVVRRGMERTDVIRRFLHEQRFLANLNHPNIAQLYSAGVTSEGIPFLAMEYVDGTRIDRFCDENSLTIPQRLEIFDKVCAAIDYAHQRLVVHRDIKASNILVTREGEPKLLDFGIAKLLDSVTNQSFEQTITLQKVMTPEYASPEQIRGEPITMASDVYSLGILLYELLAGSKPYRIESTAPVEIARVITEVEPKKPSAAVRERSPDGLPVEARDPRLLRGDLDNIVLMALRKEPERRYRSVGQFAEDIRRHLESLPVRAREDTFIYRGTRFFQRHKVGVVTGGVVALLLLTSLAGVVWQARVAAREREQAQLEKARAESIAEFLERTLNYSNPVVNPAEKGDHETTMGDVLDEAARRLESGEFSDQPEVKAELLRIIATSYDYLGKRDLMQKYFKDYIALESRLYEPDHPKALAAREAQAMNLFSDGNMTEAEKIYREILPRMRQEEQQNGLGPEILGCALADFGCLRRTQGYPREAELAFRELLALEHEIPEQFYYLIGTTRGTLAATLADEGRFDEALQIARESVENYQRRKEGETPDSAFALTVLGGILIEEGNFREADSDLRQAESILRSRPSSLLWLGDTLRNQAISCYRQGKIAQALAKADRALEIYRENFGPHYDQYPTALIVRGLALARMGEVRQGEKDLREAVRLRVTSLPKDHCWVALANGALGECLVCERQYEQAEPLLLESYESLKKSQGFENPRTARARDRIVKLYDSWGKPDAAAKYRASG